LVGRGGSGVEVISGNAVDVTDTSVTVADSVAVVPVTGMTSVSVKAGVEISAGVAFPQAERIITVRIMIVAIRFPFIVNLLLSIDQASQHLFQFCPSFYTLPRKLHEGTVTLKVTVPCVH